MSGPSIPHPAADEAAPFYQGYIAEVRGENIGDLLREQAVEVERLFRPLDDTGALKRYAPGKWSVKEVLGHITDAERIFAYRLLRIARGDKTPLPGFDENAYVPAAHFDRRAVAELIEDFQAVRTSSRTLVGGIPQESWTLVGEASGKAISARALAYIMVGHVAHHVAVLRERYRLG
jgi:uncharacterized damage-inducible protein DinB